MSAFSGYRLRLQRWDEEWCTRLNRGVERRTLRTFFQAIGRLGNGAFWYILMAALPAVQGAAALPVIARMIGAGLVATVIYKWVKARTVRLRPYQVRPSIRAGATPLDKFSFPSGHTLHAVAFSTVLVAYYPSLGWLVLPFTALVALSRLVLGLHYPSDVIAGAGIGLAVAQLAFVF